MRELADDGKIIMCVIHQPSSQTFDLFTHLLLLAKGRVVYNGPMATLQSYFSSLGVICPRFHNPADFFINQISIVPTKQEASMARLKLLWDSYEGSNLAKGNMAWKADLSNEDRMAKHRAVSMKHFHASMGTQFYYTMKRNIQNEYRYVYVLSSFPSSLSLVCLPSLYFSLSSGADHNNAFFHGIRIRRDIPHGIQPPLCLLPPSLSPPFLSSLSPTA